MQDKIVMGRSPTKALASTGGANTVASTGNSSGNAGNTSISTPTLSSHNHNPGGNRFGGFGSGYAPSGATMDQSPSGTSNSGGGGAHSHTINTSFTGTANSVLQPYLTVIYIIKT